MSNPPLPMQKILVIDDDRDMRLLLTRYLQKFNYEVIEAYNQKNAIEVLEKVRPDIILCDFKLGDSTGTSLLIKIKEKYSDVPVVIITGYGDIRIAVEVIKLGAFDYVTKPLFPDEILLTIRKALEMSSPAGATEQVKRKATGQQGQYILADTSHFKALIEQIDRVAPTKYSVIIYGETGSGKEAIAAEIHKRSERRLKPFIAIDCGALSKELAGSELFGHEKGAFTGAVNQKIGSFENANGGTIFLDEIANLPYDVQVSLLRVLSERKMRRVGGVKDIDFDARIIVASNEALWDNERKNKPKFREDLFHRLNEFSITVPPLRERKEDVRIFATHFLALTNEDLGRSIEGFTPEVLRIFDSYVWYGNLRELKNVVKRAALLTDDDWIDVRSMPFEISNFEKLQFDQMEVKRSTMPQPDQIPVAPRMPLQTLKDAGKEAEYEIIMAALKEANFNKSKAAKILDIDRKTLYNKLEQHQLLK
jgi:two-component system, NtrC family, response regulator HydG